MSSNDWLEVKRLAADFQRAQLSSNLQRLTEGNCVEIITKLQKLHLLNVVFTNDGKSFVTKQHLLKEITDELYVHGGRISIIDLSKSLNVDVDVVSTLTQDLLKSQSDLCVVLGQLIDQSYITHIAEDINEKLHQHGYISVSDLTRAYDLPGDFIHSIIRDSTGKIITSTRQDKSDTHVYYTDSYFARNRAIIRGAVLAITKPTSISNIMNQSNIDEHLFHSMVDSLIELKQIPGFLTDRFSANCTYIPNVYIKNQNELIRNSFNQNCYLEYNALTRAGISEPKTFISKALPGNKLLYLKTCLIGQQILDNVEAAVEDAVLSSNLWIDVMTVLPVTFETEDAEMIVEIIMKKDQFRTCCHLFNKTFIVSNNFISVLNSLIVDQLVTLNTQQMISSGKYEDYVHKCKISEINEPMIELSRKEERKKRTPAGKSGGGTRGRETKIKTVKKKYGQKNASKFDESDEEEDYGRKPAAYSASLVIVNMDDLRHVISKHQSFDDLDSIDCDELITDLVDYFYPLINKVALNKCKLLYDTRMAEMSNSRRKTNAILQDTMLSLYQDVKLYQKGIKQLADSEDIEQQFNKYLLKTTATQLVNNCLAFIGECDEPVNTVEDRLRILTTINDKIVKENCTKLHKSLTGSFVDDFLCCVEVAFSCVNIMVKKIDKKKEKALLESHKKALMDKLSETEDPALVLHLVCMILFQEASQAIINVPGRFVSNIVRFLKQRVPSDVYSSLNQYHSLVLNMLSPTEKNEVYINAVEELKKLTPELKRLAATNKVSHLIS